MKTSRFKQFKAVVDPKMKNEMPKREVKFANAYLH